MLFCIPPDTGGNERGYTVSRTIMLIPTGTSVGLTSVSLGVIRAMERKGVRLSVFKPIAQPRSGGDAPDQTTTIVRASSSTTTAAEPLKMSHVESLLSSNQKDVLMEEIIANYHANTQDAEVVLVEGLVPTRKHQFAQALNFEIAKTLNAEIVFVMSQGTDTPEQLNERIELTRNSFGGAKNTSITGVIVNKLNAPVDDQGRTRPDLSEIFDDSSKAKIVKIDPAQLQKGSTLPVLGAVPWSFDLIATRAIDMAHHLNATIINEGDINTRRVKSVTFCARSIPHMLEHFRPGSLLVTSADRPDVLVAEGWRRETAAALGGRGQRFDPVGVDVVGHVFLNFLDTLVIVNRYFEVKALQAQGGLPGVGVDHEYRQAGRESAFTQLADARVHFIAAGQQNGADFHAVHCRQAGRNQLTELARKAGKRVVLPEGDEPRTVKAAAICAERGIATCVLLGNPDEINRVAAAQGVELGAGIEIVDPEVVRESYVGRLVELRKNKGMTEAVAREQLEDNVVLGTLMLEQDEVDGLVSGAVHTTANTIRPPLQLIKTAPGSSLVSSVFFMLLPEQVYVYGDCAINPDPTAEQLAEIAIQSAESAIAFGIEPRVAMLSYSTGTSGAGSDVEKVREATRLAQEKRPDLMIDGPLQYDAAVMADVAKSKAPNSPVAGRATVFIFPDLNTGNTTYKAVQRSADLISIGPMLQGMRKPVNDLSRGALVDDIVYTIALTAIQSAQQQK